MTFMHPPSNSRTHDVEMRKQPNASMQLLRSFDEDMPTNYTMVRTTHLHLLCTMQTDIDTMIQTHIG